MAGTAIGPAPAGRREPAATAEVPSTVRCAVHGGDAVADVGQAPRRGRRRPLTGRSPCRRRPPRRSRSPAQRHDPWAAGPGVLRNVGEGFAHGVVRHGLHVGVEALLSHLLTGTHRDRDGEACRARLDRGNEAVVAEDLRVDAVGELAQVGEGLAGLVLQLGELLGAERAAVEPVAGEAQASHQRDDVLLDAVVQIALDAPALGVLGGDEPQSGGRELLELLGELGVEPHVGDRGRGLSCDRLQKVELGQAVVAVAARPQLDAAEPGVAERQVLTGHGLPGHRARHPDRWVRPAAVGADQPDAHPRGVEPVADTVGQAGEDLVELDRLLEPRAQLGEQRQVVVAVAEDGAPRTSRWSKPRTGRRTTASTAVSSTALTGSRRPTAAGRPGRHRDGVEERDERVRGTNDDLPRSASPTS